MSAPQRIGVVDYGTGNLASVVRAFERLGRKGIHAEVVAKPGDLAGVDKIVLPGIGHFARTMAELRARELLEALHDAARVRKIPVLGICLGMQLMTSHGEEGDAPGLGWVEGKTIRFRVDDTLRYKIPNIGWSRVSVRKRDPVFAEIADDAEFYYAHRYIVDLASPGSLAAESSYERPFTAAFANDNLFGVQFHPEKSHHVGQRLLQNFAAV